LISAILTALLFAIVLLLTCIAYLNNRARSYCAGGFIFSPVPFILLNYFLIFAYRPFVVLSYDAPTLNYVNIDPTRAYQVIQLGLLSLIAVLLPYLVKIRSHQNFHGPKLRFVSNFSVNRLVWLNLLLFLLVVLGVSIYGSALNNTGDRIENPGAYRGFFVFIVVQRFHFVLSALTFYIYHSLNSGYSIQKLFLLLSLVLAPFLSLLAAGRGAVFYILIAYLIIYVLTNSLRITWKHIFFVGILGVVFSYANFILAIVRVVISTPDWQLSDVIDALSSNLSVVRLEDSLILASWDYSVFDVFVNIVNELDAHTLGVTNLQYFLSYVPRIFWPEKPLDQGFMLYITNKFYSDVFSQTGSTFAGTLAGEGYLNFGIVGIVLYSFIFSSVLFLIYRTAIKKSGHYSVIIYGLAFPYAQQVIRGGLDVMVNFAIMIVIPLLLLTTIVRHSRLNVALPVSNS